MSAPLLPFWRLTFSTALSADDIRARLQGLLHKEPGMLSFAAYVGRVDGDTFELRANVRDAGAATIRGEISDGRVVATARLHLLVIAFLTAFCGLLCFGVYSSLRVGSLEGTRIPGLMLLLVLLTVPLAFRLRTAADRKTLEAALEATSVVELGLR